MKKTVKRPRQRTPNLPLAPADAEYLTPPETARELGVSPGTLNIWRTTKRHGLPYIKIGKYIRFDPQAVRAFLARQSRSTESPIR